MIFLDYLYELPNSTSGLDQIAKDTVNVFPAFSPIILFFVFFVVFLGGVARQRIKTGTADYPVWAVLGSISTLLIALLFSVQAGFIRLDWLVIVVTVNILSAIWFFLDQRATEV